MGIGGSQTHIRIVSDCRSPGTLRNGLSFLHALAEAVPLPGIYVHILVEKFSVFGLEIQYWLPSPSAYGLNGSRDLQVNEGGAAGFG